VSLKYGVLNLLVLSIIILLVSKTYRTWTEPAEKLGKEAARQPVVKAENPQTVEGKKEPSNISSNKIMSERNIFSPERKDFPIQTGPVKKPVIRPQIILYGITIAGEYQSASISNPGRPLKKGEREVMTLKIGDRIGEYGYDPIIY
jgi:hypothetical protein